MNPLNSAPSSGGLLQSPPPMQMSEWGKNKIKMMAQLSEEGLLYSKRSASFVLECDAAHLIIDDFYYLMQQKSKNLSFKKEVVVLTQVLSDGLGDY